MDETIYISDCNGILQTEIEGTFSRLDDGKGTPVSCFVNSTADAITIAELVECCGYTFSSVIGKRVRIIIEDV